MLGFGVESQFPSSEIEHPENRLRRLQEPSARAACWPGVVRPAQLLPLLLGSRQTITTWKIQPQFYLCCVVFLDRSSWGDGLLKVISCCTESSQTALLLGSASSKLHYAPQVTVFPAQVLYFSSHATLFLLRLPQKVKQEMVKQKDIEEMKQSRAKIGAGSTLGKTQCVQRSLQPENLPVFRFSFEYNQLVSSSLFSCLRQYRGCRGLEWILTFSKEWPKEFSNAVCKCHPCRNTLRTCMAVQKERGLVMKHDKAIIDPT